MFIYLYNLFLEMANVQARRHDGDTSGFGGFGGDPPDGDRPSQLPHSCEVDEDSDSGDDGIGMNIF